MRLAARLTGWKIDIRSLGGHAQQDEQQEQEIVAEEIPVTEEETMAAIEEEQGAEKEPRETPIEHGAQPLETE